MNTPWIQLANGKPFEPFNCKPEDITIEVIAASLSKICRFNGHTKRFYSVAEHSYYVMTLVPQHLALPALLHDAHEAYTGFGDVVSPMKSYEVKKLERDIDTVIAAAFGFDPQLFYEPEMSNADLRMLATEKRDIMLPSEREWSNFLPEPAGFKINPVEFTCSQIEQNFLRIFFDLASMKKEQLNSFMES